MDLGKGSCNTELFRFEPKHMRANVSVSSITSSAVLNAYKYVTATFVNLATKGEICYWQLAFYDLP